MTKTPRPAAPPAPPASLPRLLSSITLARLVVNVCRRFAYPFVPALARGLGVSPAAVQGAIAVQGGVGVLSPLFGPLAERFGRRRVMLGALLLMAAAAAAGAARPSFGSLAAVLALFGAGKMIFDPAMQAYVGDRVPYARRGLAMGVIETSWAGALFVAAPLAAWLLGAGGVRAVLLAWAGLLLAAFAVLAAFLPGDRPAGRTRAAGVTGPLAAWRILRGSRAALGGLGYSLLLVVANELFFINYGLWLERSFGLALAALGTVTLTVAAAEVAGEGIVIAFADRLGKRRLALWGAWLSAPAYLALPLLGNTLPAALAALFLVFLCVEVSIVASLPLFTDVLPGARAVMMSGNVGAHALGRLLGAAAGGALYAALRDFRVVGLAAALLALASAALLHRSVREGGGGA